MKTADIALRRFLPAILGRERILAPPRKTKFPTKKHNLGDEQPPRHDRMSGAVLQQGAILRPERARSVRGRDVDVDDTGGACRRCSVLSEVYWEITQVRGTVAVRPWSALVAVASSCTVTT